MHCEKYKTLTSAILGQKLSQICEQQACLNQQIKLQSYLQNLELMSLIWGDQGGELE